jgi:acylglycerol lipase
MPIRTLFLLLGACILGACITPRVQLPGNEPQQPRIRESHAEMADGTRLPLRRWQPKAGEPRVVLLALHGLNDYGAAFEEVGEYLAELGFAVYAFDQRGFGATLQRGIWPGADVLADDALQVAELLRERYSGAPLYVLGESMGGAVLLQALRLHGSDWLDGAALIAPAVWSRGHMRRYQRWPLALLAHTWRGLKLSGRITGKTATDDPKTLDYLAEDPWVLRKTRTDVLWGIADLMDSATKHTQFAIPTLILYGERDEIVPARPTCAWIKSLDPTDAWQFAVYPNGWHLLTRDLDAPTLRADLASWLAEPGSSLPSGADQRGLPFCADSRASVSP